MNQIPKEIRLAFEIYKAELNNENIWEDKLNNNLKDQMSKEEIEKSLNTLSDWGIISYDYGEIKDKKDGRLLKISTQSKSAIKDLYSKRYK